MKAEKTPEEVKALEHFNVITEAASALMDAGEMDIYSAVWEELQRAAKRTADEDDMFADADEGATTQVRAASCPVAMHASRHSLAPYDINIKLASCSACSALPCLQCNLQCPEHLSNCPAAVCVYMAYVLPALTFHTTCEHSWCTAW